MPEVEHLVLEDLLAAAEAFLGGAPQVRDVGLLESALARPRASAFGEPAYPDLVFMAAALFESLTRNHALVDGNKRLGYVGLRLFLLMNGCDLTADEDTKVELVVAVADGSLAGVEAITHALRPLVRVAE